VTISNLVGVTISSNATLAVGYAPTITVQPQSQEVKQGSNVSFTVTATGTGPLSYQWYFAGSILAQDTNATLSLANVQGANGGSYSVVVSSPFGSAVSSNAMLTVDLLPVIVTQPTNQTVFVGFTAAFVVTVSGTPPFTYQWQFNTTNINGATNSTLTLTNVTFSQAGSYSVTITNISGVTNSANAVLTVNPPPPCAPVPSGVISWWPADGNALDIEGTNNGTLENGATFASGEVGQAFSFNGVNQYVQIADSPSLRPLSVTLELWFNASNTGNGSLISKPVGAGSSDSSTIWLQSGNLNGAVGNSSAQETVSYAFTPVPGVWYHTAYTYDSNLQTQTLYLNGAVVASGQVNIQMGYDSHPVLMGSEFDSGVLVLPFNGRIDEASIYNRALTATEVASIYAAAFTGKCLPTPTPPAIVTPPTNQMVSTGSTVVFSVVADGTPPLAYQWQFDGTNIAGATNTSVTVTNANFNNAGSYNVTVTNKIGSTNAVATLTVGDPPSITVQPQSQEVAQGSYATFSVTAAGTGPLSYQWYYDGAALAQDTNAALSLTDVQSTNNGSYNVVVSSPFGSAVSSNAMLTVDLLPSIVTQPQSQAALVGGNVTFSVVAEGVSSPLPPVTSGTLQLWLKADAGVITNSAGLVSQWQDQSGNANHASQSSANYQPLLVSAAGLGGKAAVRFANGYLHGVGSVGVPNAMTAFTVYNAFAYPSNDIVLWMIGVPGSAYGACRGDGLANFGYMRFSTWTYDYTASFIVPTNTYRLRTDRLDTNLDTLNMFDATTSGGTNFTFSVSGALTPDAGYYVAGVDASLPYVVSGRFFDGDIAEVIIYQGYLTETDRLAVQAYLEQKYYQSGSSNGLSYQWQFDGNNIAGATNASLTLANVQIANDGVYTVIVSDGTASVTSSNATLTVGGLPVIATQPASQSVESNCNAAFNVSASGVQPLSYQWWENSLPLAAQTNSILAVTNTQASNFGSYTVVVTNIFGAATSSVAVLALASPPVANPDVILRFAEGGVRVNVSDLTSNDTVALYDALTLTAVSSNSAAGGAVSLNGPWVYYAPPAAGATNDTFTYTISDGYCGTATGTVAVQIKADNPQPLNFAITNMGNGALQMIFDGIPGETYHLQYSESLSPPNWQVLTNQSGDGYGMIQFTDSPVTNAPARFYRAIWP
jgi:hypothetical protein